MTYSIIYSATGNTKLLADKIYEFLKEKNVIYFGMTNEEALKADIIFVGFWTNQNRCDDLTSLFLKQITTQKVFLYGTAGFGLSNDYFVSILNNTKAFIKNNSCVIGEFMCQGKMHQEVREKYLKMKETASDSKKIDMLISNFDEALKHPNEIDLNNLIKCVQKI